MRQFRSRVVRTIGEAMVEIAPVGGGNYRQGFAGDTFNTAWHMAQWVGPGAEVGFVSRLGNDSLSDAFAAEMAADGMVLTGISRDPQRRMGLYLIELDGAERSFHYWRETSAARRLADDPTVLGDSLAGAGVIHLSGITLAILDAPAQERLFHVLTTMRAEGAVVSFDPNIRPRLWSSEDHLRRTMTRMLALTDIALPSFDDEARHFGDADPASTLRRMALAGVTEAVVKDGAGAVHLLDGERMVVVETPPVAAVRDTTGAGDAFNAGYLSARLLGRGMDGAVRAGQALAAEVIGHFGARAPKAALARLPRPESF